MQNMSINATLVQIPKDLVTDRTALERLMLEEGLELGKAWQALHWVLAGGDSFGESAVSGGEALTDVDHGSAPPPQLVTPAEVGRFAEELEAMTEARVRALFDLEAMAGDDVWPSNPDLEEIVALAAKVRAYYASASEAGCGMLQVFS